MIIPMTSGGYKVFSQENVFIGAYNNEQLANEIDRLGRPLTTQEFNTLMQTTTFTENSGTWEEPIKQYEVTLTRAGNHTDEDRNEFVKAFSSAHELLGYCYLEKGKLNKDFLKEKKKEFDNLFYEPTGDAKE